MFPQEVVTCEGPLLRTSKNKVLILKLYPVKISHLDNNP